MVALPPITNTRWPSPKTAPACSLLLTSRLAVRMQPERQALEECMARRRNRRTGPPRPRERAEETTQDTIRTEGVVLEARPNTTFLVQLDVGPEILAHVGGKMRRHYIRILPGDRVVVEISTYDPEKGRIVYRK